jgi:hypothetical protein
MIFPHVSTKFDPVTNMQAGRDYKVKIGQNRGQR